MSALYYIIGGSIFLLGVIVSLVSSRTAKALMAGLVVAVAAFLAVVFTPNLFLGDLAWYDESPWREIILYTAMIAGMSARTLSTAIEAKKQKKKPAAGLPLDKWDFAYPMLVSFITFGAVMGQLGAAGLSLMTLIFSFQNGFFWQTLIKKAH